MLSLFRMLGWLEGFSFLSLLFIAMPLKYYFSMPELVKILGPVHGFLFVGYCAFAFLLATTKDWPIGQHFLAYLAAVLPFGTFIFERRYLSKI